MAIEFEHSVRSGRIFAPDKGIDRPQNIQEKLVVAQPPPPLSSCFVAMLDP